MSRKLSERPVTRIADLAVLPVFLDLKGRPALVAGGSDAAAWKAELLAAAGAEVVVAAARPGEEMQRIAAERTAIRLLARDWQAADFTGAAIAVADPDTVDPAAFSAAARNAGVPVNLIDCTEGSDFAFGSIVNRSPVVIGISTSGAAPVLGQAVRRRIETLLPEWLGRWGAIAAGLRRGLRDRLPSPDARRTFWTGFAERAFLSPPADGDDGLASVEPASGGKVTLVGAGPGAAELLTLKAVRALQAADVILFDDLVSDEVLDLARREAKRMLVGKRGGRTSCRQEDINATMLALARQGRNVVRLKSGDPAVFGRAGEEIAALRAAGIAVTIVPGITAASGMAAALGVSLTHRDHAQSLRLVTGHSRDGVLPAEINWRGIADGRTTSVFYMSGRTAPDIATRLMAEGLAPETPVAFGWDISRAGERIWQGSLAEAALAPAEHPSAPMLMAVGDALAAGAAADAVANGRQVA